MFVKERYYLDDYFCDYLTSLVPKFGFNGFGELVFYRTYSRVKDDGMNESWADCVIRVINGMLSIRADWYRKNHIHWDEGFWQSLGQAMALSMFKFEWCPPGRGLWAMGTDFVYNRGSMALVNCAVTRLSKQLGFDIEWMMDALMHGVGVGFLPERDDKLKMYNPIGNYDYVIPDTREGWCESVRLQIESYTEPDNKKPRFIYDEIRGPGLPIKGFGGISSGPEPLRQLHLKIDEQFALYQTRKQYDSVYLKTNIANLVGCAVVAGNVRRSAEIACGSMDDPVFKDLKDYDKYPERAAFGWMSNNSVALATDEDFEQLGEIATRVVRNGEPGFVNLKNFPFGRIGKSMDDLRYDDAIATNPCGEIPLEDKELCNLAETLPTMCDTASQWLKGCEYASVYCSTVSLLPTHQACTNRVILRNRRIGVGIIDFTGWKHNIGVHKVTKYLREGYDAVRNTNSLVNDEAGVPRAIRVTTVKPSGTVSKLPGRTAGASYPTFRHTLRRIRVAKNSPIHSRLIAAGIPYEEDYFDKYTDVFEYPIVQGPAQPAEEVTVWEQGMNIVLLQREWADNAVSNTLYFKPAWQLVATGGEEVLVSYFGHAAHYQICYYKMLEYLVPDKFKAKIIWDGPTIAEVKMYEYNPDHEERDIEPVLSAIAPVTKSISVLPHTPAGVYRQMPEEGISEEEYNSRLAKISKIDWHGFCGSDGIDEKYCSGPVCELPASN